MQSVLLRSGDIKDYTALGQDGQTVYSMASQLREAIRLKTSKELADHLAIPKRNEQGSRIDWYVPAFEPKNPTLGYSIIPWTSATQEERDKALPQLNELRDSLLTLGEKMRNTEGLKGDQLLFSRLLNRPASDDPSTLKAIHFPDPEHVYLVDGKPVITFWGFKKKGESPYGEPFLCLQPSAPVAPIAPTVAAATPIAETVSRPWWRRWLFWLLAIPLLLALLFLLRSCSFMPSLPFFDTPKLPAVDVPKVDLPHIETPNINVETPNISGNVPAVGSGLAAPELNGNGGAGLVDGNGVGQPDAGTDNGLTPDDLGDPNTVKDDGEQATPDTGMDNADQATPDATPANDAESTNQDNNSPADPNAQNNQGANNPAAKELNIPQSSLSSGNMDFLNGHWMAKGGIQDKATGKPLGLDYQFNDGKGTVKIQRGDGVECTGNVSAGLNGQTLNIQNAGMATCSDGSTYMLPNVSCQTDSSNETNCDGNYSQGESFPIFMKGR